MSLRIFINMATGFQEFTQSVYVSFYPVKVSICFRTNEEPDDVQKASSVGTMSVFDINPDAILFFVGGVPTSADLNGRVNSLRFKGCIEEVEFDGLPIGLWDFVLGENNNQGCARR